jgi:hypothetical protein
MMLAGISTLLALLGSVASTYAQTSPAPDDSRRMSIFVRYEYRYDRSRYRFENPSSFNTPFTVPHFFEQHYRADNQWLIAGARYHLFDSIAETEFGLTPQRVSVGDDYDTFFQPEGNTVVYGTTADISLRSLRFSQRLESRPVRGWVARVGYIYQRDRSIFHPSLSTTTQTAPPSVSSFWNTDRESTISEVHEVAVGAARSFVLSPRWTVDAVADLAPIRLAKLTTILPDKYPGQDIVFLSKGFSFTPGLVAGWRRARLAVDVAIAYSTTWNYRSSDQFHRTTAAAGIRVRFMPG